MGALDGKVAVVTGAGRGLGSCHALLMAQEGAKVVINDVGAELDGSGKATGPADEIVEKIKSAGGEAVVNYESVIDFQGAKRIIDCAIESYGKLDILVNNAGFLRDRMTFKMSEEEWDAVIAVHLKGTFNCGRWACAYFREQSKAGKLESGRIINTTSHAGLLGNAGQGNYGAAKAGIAALTIIWAREMEKYKVTCNAVCPMARTRMTSSTEGLRDMFGEKPAEGQWDEWAPDNVSPLVVYLASDQAQGITGRAIAAGGGKLELFLPWHVGNSIDIGRKWTVKEIGERIGELGDLSMPGALM